MGHDSPYGCEDNKSVHDACKIKKVLLVIN